MKKTAAIFVLLCLLVSPTTARAQGVEWLAVALVPPIVYGGINYFQMRNQTALMEKQMERMMPAVPMQNPAIQPYGMWGNSNTPPPKAVPNEEHAYRLSLADRLNGKAKEMAVQQLLDEEIFSKPAKKYTQHRRGFSDAELCAGAKRRCDAGDVGSCNFIASPSCKK